MEALHTIPESSDTVLVAMGFCGGSWKDIDTEKRIVIPKVDDCITLMLHTDDSPHFNLKQATHLYMRDPYGDDFGSMPVSYTHLDVYKRQLLQYIYG